VYHPSTLSQSAGTDTWNALLPSAHFGIGNSLVAACSINRSLLKIPRNHHVGCLIIDKRSVLSSMIFHSSQFKDY
jgi:hypothetical protein